MPAFEEPSTSTQTAIGPWLMLAGVGGIVLGVLGFPAPVLSCLLLVGLGADSDLARRTAKFHDAGVGHLATPVRAVHASLYVWLYAIGWIAMAEAASFAGGSARDLLLGDLSASLILLGLAAIQARRCWTT